MLDLDTTYPCTKFDHSSFSSSRDMIGPPPKKKFNGSRDLATPCEGCFVVLGLGLATVSLPTKFEVYISPSTTKI